MELLVLIIVMFGLWWLWDTFRKSDAPVPARRETASTNYESEAENERQRALSILSDALNNCLSDHAQAVDALLWLAGSDGTVSKQEARNVFRFCEQQGTQIGKEVYAALEHLNNGMSFKLRKSTPEVMDGVAQLAGKEMRYRVAFIGAAHAICGGSKRISAVKQKFLDQIAKLVEVEA